jgi:hypothetical protein
VAWRSTSSPSFTLPIELLRNGDADQERQFAAYPYLWNLLIIVLYSSSDSRGFMPTQAVRKEHRRIVIPLLDA